MPLRKIEKISVTCPKPNGEEPELAFVPIASLRIDDAYQRPIEVRGEKNIERIARNFDWGRFSPLLLARLDDGQFAVIDGQFAVIDGQHRAHAALACGIERVPALISDLDPAQQAAAFTWVNGTVTALTPNQIFRAALAAMEPWAVQCDAAVARAGCRLMPYNKSANSRQPGEVFCVSLVRKFVEAGGATNLVAVLKGLKMSGVADKARWYNADGLRALMPVAAKHGITRPEVIANFLKAHSLDDAAARVHRLRAQPEYAQTSFSKLFNDAIAVLFKKWFLTAGADQP